MEMPVDILNHRLGKIRDNGDIDFDNTDAAVNIDIELSEKFVIIPREEIADVEIEMDRDRIHAGSGPEHCQAGLEENPAWLFNHAVNCLALYQYLMDREKLVKEQEKIALLAKRPAPGIYHTRGSGHLAFTAIVTADRRVIVPMEDGELLDQSHLHDAQGWNMRPIDITDGTISK